MIVLVVTKSTELRRTLTEVGDTIQPLYYQTIENALFELEHKGIDLIVIDLEFIYEEGFKKLSILYEDRICYYIENLRECVIDGVSLPGNKVIHVKSPRLVYQILSRVYQANNSFDVSTQEQLNDTIELLDTTVGQVDTLNKRVGVLEKRTGWEFWKPCWWHNLEVSKMIIGSAAIIVALSTVLPVTVNFVGVVVEFIVNLYTVFASTGG